MPIKMDAQFLFTVVVLFTTFDAQVLAQNSTASPSVHVSSTISPTKATSTPAMSATVTGTPSPTTTKAPVSTTSTPAPGFETRLVVILKLEEKRDDDIKANLTTGVKGLYSDVDYNLENVDIKMDDKEKCTVNITVRFGKDLKSTDIVKKFENANESGAINTIKVTLQSIQVQVKGVTLEYVPIDCKSKCCGTGGPIDMKRTCKPELKCVNYQDLTKTVKDCSTVCTKDECSAGAQLQMSLVILIFGFFVNWLLKE